MRSRPATRIRQTTVTTSKSTAQNGADPALAESAVDASVADVALNVPEKKYTEAEAIACSLENPESCEACQ